MPSRRRISRLTRSANRKPIFGIKPPSQTAGFANNQIEGERVVGMLPDTNSLATLVGCRLYYTDVHVATLVRRTVGVGAEQDGGTPLLWRRKVLFGAGKICCRGLLLTAA